MSVQLSSQVQPVAEYLPILEVKEAIMCVCACVCVCVCVCVRARAHMRVCVC